MKWTCEKPKRAGYYWYLGPVLKRDFDRVKNGADIRECTWGPIIAGVGILFLEAKTNSKVWGDGKRVHVGFYGSTVIRWLSEIPAEAMWSGLVMPPFYKYAYESIPENIRTISPFTSELNAAELTAWTDAL